MTHKRYKERVRQENSYWRDAKISQRHRHWGFECPTVDVDWLAVDYTHGRPVALIDWKALGAPEPHLDDTNYRALRMLANGCNIPFLIVFYDSLNWCFRVIPANERALVLYQTIRVMSEVEFVGCLYELRGINVPYEISKSLSCYKPQEAK
jgi:hypothetical protein